MIYYRSKIRIIRNNMFKKHNTLLKYFLKQIISTYKDIYFALNNNVNCITMNDKCDISDAKIIYAKYLGIDIIDEYIEKVKKFDECCYNEKNYRNEHNNMIW